MDIELKQRKMVELRLRVESEALDERSSPLVWGEGPLDAPIALVGEAPGRAEEALGRPFVGASGRLLRKTLSEVGLPMEHTYATNAIKIRVTSPSSGGGVRNRRPSRHEIEKWTPYLLDELAILRPSVIVCLGMVAAQAVIGFDAEAAPLRGMWHKSQLGIPAISTYHPSYLARFDQADRELTREFAATLRDAMRKADYGGTVDGV